MKIFPLLLLGLIVLPEQIIRVPIFPFGKADAHPIDLYSFDAHTSVNASATVGTSANSSANSSANASVSGLECDACMYLANGLNQTILHNPKVLTIVTDDIEKVCSILPDSVQALCMNAAEQTAPLLLNHLGDFIATQGCVDLGVCH